MPRGRPAVRSKIREQRAPLLVLIPVLRVFDLERIWLATLELLSNTLGFGEAKQHAESKSAGSHLRLIEATANLSVNTTASGTRRIEQHILTGQRPSVKGGEPDKLRCPFKRLFVAVLLGNELLGRK